jgi:hypothetical protein
MYAVKVTVCNSNFRLVDSHDDDDVVVLCFLLYSIELVQ